MEILGKGRHKKARKSGVLVQGVGKNDADYVMSPTIMGKRMKCPYYECWASMLKRGYNREVKDKMPAYEDVTVCKEWLTFSNFKAWMEVQDFVGKHLDKDLLSKGNKVYGPANCIFVDIDVNALLTDRNKHRGYSPLGVTFNPKKGRFVSQISINGKRKHLGNFTDPYLAHLAWQQAKVKIMLEVAGQQLDIKVKNALNKRVEFIVNDIYNKSETLRT